MRKYLFIILSSFAVLAGLLLIVIATKTTKNRIINFLTGVVFIGLGLYFIYLIASGAVIIALL